jgi:hypothetical protein
VPEFSTSGFSRPSHTSFHLERAFARAATPGSGRRIDRDIGPARLPRRGGKP